MLFSAIGRRNSVKQWLLCLLFARSMSFRQTNFSNVLFRHTLNVVERARVYQDYVTNTARSLASVPFRLQSDRVRCKLRVSWSWTKSKQRTSVKVFRQYNTGPSTNNANETNERTEVKQKQSRTKRIKAKEWDTQHHTKTNNQKCFSMR